MMLLICWNVFVLDKQFVALLPAIRQIVVSCKKPSNIYAIMLTKLKDGIDMVVKVTSALSKQDKENFTSFAQIHDVIRINEYVDGQFYPIIQTNKPNVQFGEASVTFPAGGFLQASEIGERSITNLVIDHLQSCNVVADLYSGCGTYSFPLAKKPCRVAAFEGEEVMVHAMVNAIHKAGLDTRVSATIRDLHKNPLSVEELSPFDGVVINPPRVGAKNQIRNIAKSALKKLIMVSCNPVSFETDARFLLGSGFSLRKVTPIDQFYWSSHLELVASFER